ncbi:MAG: gamma-glutamyltransferase [Candidatus Latescibacteria bacterium]|nr:gamma-glutamyltransferase [Candidatus Latescibacterota bacterium]
MTLATAFALAAALWTGGDTPPDSLQVIRTLPAADKAALTTDTAMVAAAHPLASEAGRRALAAGGNFADAAVAVQAMLAVVEPESSGPGGGCFLLFHDMATDSLYAIDGREEAPAWFRASMFVNEHGQPVDDIMTGGMPVGVPGTLAAMALLHQDFGRLPFAELMEAAIAVADTGFPVPPDMARGIVSEADRLARFDASVDLYFHPDGTPYREGETFRNPDLAKTLRLWADDPAAQFFYRGELGLAMSGVVGSNSFRKGRLRISDLANYKALYREPILGSFRGHTLAVMPPPTSGGIALLEMLGLYATQPKLGGDPHDAATLIPHLDRLARASRTAYADRDRWLGDPDWSPEIPMRALCSPEWVASRAPAAFAPDADLTLAADPGDLARHTTHFSIVDADGSMLACTSTIETIFGCAQVVPGYGFPLNNELTDFNWIAAEDDPAPNDPQTGRTTRASSLNYPQSQGGKRPRSSMCPVIVYGADGRPAMALGSPGGSRIIGTVADVLLGVLEFDLDLQDAVDFPRLHCRNQPVELETFGWNRDVVADSLAARGWTVAPLAYWPLLQGDVNAVRVLKDGRRQGVSDPRHDGGPAGY